MARDATSSLIASLLFGALFACSDETPRLVNVEEPPDAGCLRMAEPQTFQVYFVIDASCSMQTYISALSKELVSFAGGFKPYDELGRPTRVDFYMVGFASDYKWYGGRMTSVIALQEAFSEANARAAMNLNLVHDTMKVQENDDILDALQSVIDSHPTAEARLVVLAGDGDFVEAPATLDGLPVHATYPTVLDGLRMINARMHVFALDQEGLVKSYHSMPALSALPGSTVHSLLELGGASEKIRETLSFIAREAACD